MQGSVLPALKDDDQSNLESCCSEVNTKIKKKKKSPTALGLEKNRYLFKIFVCYQAIHKGEFPENWLFFLIHFMNILLHN